MIKEYITEGKIVPMEVTIKLLENAMRDTMASPPAFAEGSPLAAQWTGGKGRFLIDGFPRKMDQALKFDETVSRVGDVSRFIGAPRRLKPGKGWPRHEDPHSAYKGASAVTRRANRTLRELDAADFQSS